MWFWIQFIWFNIRIRCKCTINMFRIIIRISITIKCLGDLCLFLWCWIIKIRYYITILLRKGFEFNFPGFPYLGIWAAKDAAFVCIEPWCGIADPVNSSQQLNEKEGINRLAPGSVFERSWSLGFEVWDLKAQIYFRL